MLSGRALRLLHIDDSSILRRTVQRGLEPFSEFYELTQAESAEDALKLLGEGKKFDVILTDWLMTGMSGLILLCHMKSNPAYHHIPVFFLTSEYDSSSLIIAMTHGAAGVLKKPAGGPEIHSYLQKKLSNIEESLNLDDKSFIPEAAALIEKIQPLMPLKSLKELEQVKDAIQEIRDKSMRAQWPMLSDYSYKMVEVIQLTIQNQVSVLTPIGKITQDYFEFMTRVLMEISDGKSHSWANGDLDLTLKNYRMNLEGGWFSKKEDASSPDDIVIPRQIAEELQSHLTAEGVEILKKYLKTG